MTTQKLEELKTLLTEFVESDIFGMGEMEYIPTVKEVIDLVDGAIFNNAQEE